LAELEFRTGNTSRAIELARENLTKDYGGKNISSLAFQLNNLTAYLIRDGQLEQARGYAREGLRKAIDVQIPALIAGGIQHLAALEATDGALEHAALLLGFTNAMFGAYMARETTEQMEYDSAIAELRDTLGEATLNGLLQRGAGMTQEQAVAQALSL
jgi:hypothetical protein